MEPSKQLVTTEGEPITANITYKIQDLTAINSEDAKQKAWLSYLESIVISAPEGLTAKTEISGIKIYFDFQKNTYFAEVSVSIRFYQEQDNGTIKG